MSAQFLCRLNRVPQRACCWHAGVEHFSLQWRNVHDTGPHVRLQLANVGKTGTHLRPQLAKVGENQGRYLRRKREAVIL
jgi:hypothetical protein